MDVVTQDEKFEIAQEIRIEKYFFASVKIQYSRIRFIIHNLFHVHNLKKKLDLQRLWDRFYFGLTGQIKANPES